VSNSGPELDSERTPPGEVEIVDEQGVGVQAELPFYSITSYGADYPVDGLVKRLAAGSIIIPEFQRGYVWNLNQASRFVESLLLGLPVPGIFFAREKDTQKMLVIDGQQRLRTLEYFYDGCFDPLDKPFMLTKTQRPFLDATYKTLSDEDRRRLDDSIIHATIVYQESPTEDDSSIYQIFERLNTGGIRLSPQEIRASIYHGALARLLHRLNESGPWREIYGPVSPRMRDQEMILRFLALFFGGTYEEYMAGFLNKYMGANRDPDAATEGRITETFERSIEIVRNTLGKRAFRPKGPFNAAVYDAVMVGLSRRMVDRPISELNRVVRRYEKLLSDPAFISATETGTAHQESVEARLKLATEAFADLP
jgi:hypothetical protein